MQFRDLEHTFVATQRNSQYWLANYLLPNSQERDYKMYSLSDIVNPTTRMQFFLLLLLLSSQCVTKNPDHFYSSCISQTWSTGF